MDPHTPTRFSLEGSSEDTVERYENTSMSGQSSSPAPLAAHGLRARAFHPLDRRGSLYSSPFSRFGISTPSLPALPHFLRYASPPTPLASRTSCMREQQHSSGGTSKPLRALVPTPPPGAGDSPQPRFALMGSPLPVRDTLRAQRTAILGKRLSFSSSQVRLEPGATVDPTKTHGIVTPSFLGSSNTATFASPLTPRKPLRGLHTLVDTPSQYQTASRFHTPSTSSPIKHRQTSEGYSESHSESEDDEWFTPSELLSTPSPIRARQHSQRITLPLPLPPLNTSLILSPIRNFISAASSRAASMTPARQWPARTGKRQRQRSLSPSERGVARGDKRRRLCGETRESANDDSVSAQLQREIAVDKGDIKAVEDTLESPSEHKSCEGDGYSTGEDFQDEDDGDSDSLDRPFCPVCDVRAPGTQTRSHLSHPRRRSGRLQQQAQRGKQGVSFTEHQFDTNAGRLSEMASLSGCEESSDLTDLDIDVDTASAGADAKTKDIGHGGDGSGETVGHAAVDDGDSRVVDADVAASVDSNGETAIDHEAIENAPIADTADSSTNAVTSSNASASASASSGIRDGISANSVPHRRRLSSSIPISSDLGGLYQRYHVPHQLPVAFSSLLSSIPPLPALSSSHARPNASCTDPLNLYTPRYTRGVGATKEGLCPLCPLTKPLPWYNMKMSAYNYHLQIHHGVHHRTGRPLDPPVDLRSINVDVSSKGKKRGGGGGAAAVAGSPDRDAMMQGKCAQCKKWVDLQSVKDMDIKVPEIYWRKHAARCHKPRRRSKGDNDVGEENYGSGVFVDDDLYRRVVAVLKERDDTRNG